MDASRRTGCLPNTRTDVLRFIVDWVNDPTSQQNILWLHGLAGSGKSALSTTIASTFRELGQLGAFLFFDRHVAERSDPTTVIRTLAHQLGASVPEIGTVICAAVERNSTITISSLQHQFNWLIRDTLAITSQTIVIVLDALDECGTASEREGLLMLLGQNFVDLPFSIRTIITSRTEIDIYNVFAFRRHILAYELDITSPATSEDILSYFRHRLSFIRIKNRYLGLGEDWPGDAVIRRLVQRASGLFIWAATALEFINGHDPRKRVGVILNGDVACDAEAGLDALYGTALESAGRWDDEDFVADFQNILGVILLAREPLSSDAIDALLHMPEDRPSIHTTSLLGCILQQGPTVRVLHPSFADFLTTKDRCRRDKWYFDRSTCHRRLAFLCLDRMDAALRQNICAMTLANDIAAETLPEEISYSCVFWIDHICGIEDDFLPVVNQLRKFLFHHLLHWVEAMSVLRRSRDTISGLDRLLHWISVGS